MYCPSFDGMQVTQTTTLPCRMFLPGFTWNKELVKMGKQNKVTVQSIYLFPSLTISSELQVNNTRCLKMLLLDFSN